MPPQKRYSQGDSGSTEEGRELRCAVWFITGSSHGFGLHFAQKALAKQHRVIAKARYPREIDSTGLFGSQHPAFPSARP
jgi:hypothetical protein